MRPRASAVGAGACSEIAGACFAPGMPPLDRYTVADSGGTLTRTVLSRRVFTRRAPGPQTLWKAAL